MKNYWRWYFSLMIVAVLAGFCAGDAFAQQGRKGEHDHAEYAQADSLAQARMDSIVQALRDTQADHVTDVVALVGRISQVESRLDSLIQALADGEPPDTGGGTPPDTIPPDTAADGFETVDMDSTSLHWQARWAPRAGAADSILLLRWKNPDGSDAGRCAECSPPHPVQDAVSPVDGSVPRGTTDRVLAGFLLWQGGAGDSLGAIAVPRAGSEPPPPPPPAPGGGARVWRDILLSQGGPNEPAGFTAMTLAQTSVMNDYGGTRVCSPAPPLGDGRCFRNPEQVTDADFPGPPLLNHTYPTGWGDNSVIPNSTGRGGGTRLLLFDAGLTAGEIYATFRVKFDPIWSVSSTNFKVVGIMTPADGGKQSFWVMAGSPSGDPALWLDQKQINRTTGTNTPVVTRTSFRFTRGQVHRVEVYARTNSAPGVPDGIIRIWVDGVLRLQRTDVINYEDDNGFKHFGGFKIDPIPGGRNPAPEQWIWYDDVYMSVR